jgi:hypothetical protein
MLLSQVASQLNTHHLEEFHKALFPSGNVSKLDMLKHTLTDLGVKPVESTSVNTPLESKKAPSLESNKEPFNKSSEGKIEEKQSSRKQRRYEERLHKKVEKANAKTASKELEKDEEMRKRETEIVKKRIQTLPQRDDVERLNRILGL